MLLMIVPKAFASTATPVDEIDIIILRSHCHAYGTFDKGWPTYMISLSVVCFRSASFSQNESEAGRHPRNKQTKESH